MIEVLVAIEDSNFRDVVRTAVREVCGMQPIAAPRSNLATLLAASPNVGAVIVEFNPVRDGPLIAQLREISRSISIFAVVHRPDRSRITRLKIEHTLDAVIATPLDPYDLARRLRRIPDLLPAP